MADRPRQTTGGSAGRGLAALLALAAVGAVALAVGGDRLTLAGEGEGRSRLQIQVRGAQPVDSPAYQVVLETMLSQLETDRGVASARRGEVSGDGLATALEVNLRGDASERDDTVARLQANLDPGPLELSFAGQAGELHEARDGAIDDMRLLALGVPAILLLAAFLSPPVFMRAVFAAIATIGLAAAIAVLAAPLLDSPAMALTGIGPVGLVLPLELFLLLRMGAPRGAVSGAALAAAVASIAPIALGVGYLTSTALGAALASLLAAPAAILAASDLPSAPAADRRRRGILRRLAAAIRWSRPAAAGIAVMSLLVLLMVAVPATRLQTDSLSSANAPSISALQLAIAATIAIGGGALVVAGLSRMPGLALALCLCALLPAAAAAGLLVVVFQDGNLERLLDYQSSGAVSLGALASAAVALIALGLARGAALLVPTREWRRRGPTAALDALSVAGAAAALTSAVCAVLAITLLGSGFPFVKQFGMALALGLIADLIAVRALLAPALMRSSEPPVRAALAQ